MIVNWGGAFQAITPVGTLTFNTDVTLDSGAVAKFLLYPSACKAAIPLRATDNDIPQQDGEQTHERFYRGALITLGVVLCDSSDEPACDDLLEEAYDYLMRYVRAYTNPPADPNDARLYWPTYAGTRMIRNAILNEPADISVVNDVFTMVSFQLKSPFPYAWTQAETTTAIADGASATLTNNGNAQFWPVIKVYNASGLVTITNASVEDEFGSALQVLLDVTVAGANYAEIDMFDGTVFLNGDSTNLTSGVDVSFSDFWPLVEGANDISVVGANIEILWQNAYG